MGRKIWFAVIALVGLAAVEFGILGASAAGITGRAGRLPPIIDRGDVAATPTSTPTPSIGGTFPFILIPTPAGNPGCVPISPAACTGPASITLSPSPLTIRCDGSETSRLTVRIMDAQGAPVADGAPVNFSAYNGNTSPYNAFTANGYAATDVRFYGDFFPYGPNVIVNAAGLQAGIRIRCFPNSNGGCVVTTPPCPPSPPPCDPSPPGGPKSPPCPTPTPIPCNLTTPPCSPPPSPPPCNPSPGSGPLSPPCPAPPPPPCRQQTPPCPPPPRFELRIDCNPDTSTIDDNCLVAPGAAALDAAVVLVNRSGAASPIAAFNFKLHDSNKSFLSPAPGADANLNANPDLNEAQLGAGWQCLPPPSPDTGEDGPASAVSFLSCFNPTTIVGGLPDGGQITLARVHYTIPADAPLNASSLLQLSDVAVGDTTGVELGSCNPILAAPMLCAAASIHIGSPSPPQTGGGAPDFSMSIDCDLTTAGIQSACDVPLGAGHLDVGVVVSNQPPAGTDLASFNFELHDPSLARLTPAPGLDQAFNANPDFNEILPGSWACAPAPSNNTGVDGPSAAVSFLSCFTGGSGVSLPAGASVLVATVHYNIPSGATPGDIPLSLAYANAGNHDGLARDCNPASSASAAMECPGATVRLVEAAPLTPTAVPTHTPTPAAARTPSGAPAVASRTPAPSATPARRPPSCADVTGDGRVTVRDLIAIATHFRRNANGSRYDLNLDGRVDAGDIRIALAQLGARCRSG